MHAGLISDHAPAVNLARDPRRVIRRKRTGVLNPVAQLVDVKTLGLARSYAGPIARAAPGGPLTWGPGPRLVAGGRGAWRAVIRSQVCTYVRSYSLPGKYMRAQLFAPR